MTRSGTDGNLLPQFLQISDVSDCQWIQYPHSVGLLRAKLPATRGHLCYPYPDRGSLLEMTRTPSAILKLTLDWHSVEEARKAAKRSCRKNHCQPAIRVS